MGNAGDAVILLGFGGPTSFDEVRPFILNVTRGRSVSQERIESVIEQYRIIGGKSPFKELTQRQAEELHSLLKRRNCHVAVELGFLYWQPYVSDTIEKLLDNKVSHVVAIVMAPHRSQVSFARYIEAVDQALAKYGDIVLSIDFAPAWHINQLFIEAVADCIVAKLDLIPASERVFTKLIFTAHSIPESIPDAAGYAQQLDETANMVASYLRETHWCVAYQSKSGASHQRWLEPDVRDAIIAAKQAGFKHVLIVPIGFVCENVEVLFDLDIQAADLAGQVGMNMLRAETVGCHPKFIEMLAQFVMTRVGQV